MQQKYSQNKENESFFYVAEDYDEYRQEKEHRKDKREKKKREKEYREKEKWR